MILRCTIFILTLALSTHGYGATTRDARDDDIEIVEGEERTVYEYRTNGVLTLIKVVPKIGRPYYMVPADGSPHYESLEHRDRLYPQWVIIEW